MQFQSHRGSKTVHAATHQLHGETVTLILNAPVSNRGVVATHVAHKRAEDHMSTLHAGMARVNDGHAVEPLPFDDEDLVPVAFSHEWCLRWRDVFIRCEADDLDHARAKLGMMARHLQDASDKANA